MRVLDLFCGAGGAAKGYHDGFTAAGFDVEIVGVDIQPQPSFPYTFIQADAMTYPLDGFDFIHASPPCQFATAYKRRRDHVAASPNLIPPTRERLTTSGLPWVIENVQGAHPHLNGPIQLCGSSFGLDVRRHRLFESSAPLMALPCDHGWQTPRFPTATNRVNLRKTVEVGVWRIPLEVQQSAMGIDWMELHELSQAIPPAYTAFLAEQIAPALMERAAWPPAPGSPIRRYGMKDPVEQLVKAAEDVASHVIHEDHCAAHRGLAAPPCDCRRARLRAALSRLTRPPSAPGTGGGR